MQQSQAHGFIPKFLTEKSQVEKPEEIFEDSLVPPASYWTGQEKERFFVALQRYSRLQPELIQQEVGDSKQTWEVCCYINYLDQACAADDNTPSSSSMAKHEHAREMSSRWIASEEKWSMARNIRDYHLLTDFYERQQQQQDSPEDAEHWTTREAMRELNIPMLMALDNMLRDPTATADSDEASGSQTEERLVAEDLYQSRRSVPPEAQLSEMTPEERRRYQKRVHMRKKRAEVRGEDYDDGVELQRIGRRARSVPPEPPPKKHSKRGFVLLEKGKDFFTKAGIQREDVARDNLDIFHLSAIGKIAGLTSALSEDSDYGYSLCSETLLLLRAHLLFFLEEIIRRTIVFMNQERVRTEHTKIFKGSRDKVRAEHVRHISQMMTGEADQLGWLLRFEKKVRAAHQSKTDVEGQDEEDESMSDAETTESDSPDSSEDDDDDASRSGGEDMPTKKPKSSRPRQLVKTAYLQLRPPLLWIPDGLAKHPSDRRETDLIPGEPWNSDLYDELVDELDDEIEIEKAQRARDKEEEKELWRRVASEWQEEKDKKGILQVSQPQSDNPKRMKKRKKESSPEPTTEAEEEPKPKKRKVLSPESKIKRLEESIRYRKKGGKIKSNVYIDPDADV